MKATLIINKNYTIDEIDKRLYGTFVEHLGRVVYGGIYDPESIYADDMGFRKDVIDLVKEMNVPIVRYPGGNFVSDYKWEDGVGDRSKRVKKIDCTWQEIETNEVGTDEFQEWAKRADSSVMMAVNLGTRGPRDAKNLVEYCNLSTDTYYANMRRANGFEKPFGIKTWCLGNEMDGDWQIGNKSADEYGRIATEAAKMMKKADPEIELVVCGSSNDEIATFGYWESTVLEYAYDLVDYISLHQYYAKSNDNSLEYLGKSVRMDRFIKDIIAVCDSVRAKKHRTKRINLSFDEWNVWYHSRKDKLPERWQIAAPRVEEIYTFEDALLVGCMLMTLQNNCDRVKIACLAQLVNTLGAIMTEKDGKAWAQTIYYPFMYASVYGRGVAMRTVSKCDTYDASYAESIPYLETSVVHNEEKRELTVFAVNRNLDEEMTVNMHFEGFEEAVLFEHIVLYADDIFVTNKDKQNVVPKNEKTGNDSSREHKVTLKKHSWNMLRFKY